MTAAEMGIKFGMSRVVDIHMCMIRTVLYTVWIVVRAIGYGADYYDGYPTETLEYVDLQFVEQLQCNRMQNLYAYLADRNIDDSNYDYWDESNYELAERAGYIATYIHPGMICAWGDDKDSCQGDSGGPLMKGIHDSSPQVGVVSWGFECGICGNLCSYIYIYIQYKQNVRSSNPRTLSACDIT